MSLLARDSALELVCATMRAVGGALFVSSGNNSRAVYALDDSPRNFYALGNTGQCAALAAGFSVRAGRPVAVLDGDGAVAMGLAGLPMVAGTARAPFLHVVLDNGRYESTGGQPVPLPAGLLVTAAGAAGYDVVLDADSHAALSAALHTALDEKQVAFIRVPTTPGPDRPEYPRVPLHPREIATRFRAACRTPPGAGRDEAAEAAAG